MSHGKRKNPKRAAKAVVRRHPFPAVGHPDAAVLLGDVAEALNACEQAGISVKLAHGAVIAEAGYVFTVGPDDAPWAVRTRLLTEFPAFPVPDGDD